MQLKNNEGQSTEHSWMENNIPLIYTSQTLTVSKSDESIASTTVLQRITVSDN